MLTQWKKQEDLQFLNEVSSVPLQQGLVRENQAIAVEELSVKNMLKNHKLAQAIADASWGELVRQLEYKCLWVGRTLVKIDRWFPSSKRCEYCGHVVDKLRSTERGSAERSQSLPHAEVRLMSGNGTVQNVERITTETLMPQRIFSPQDLR
jgi:IS605 OrfB family transposase